VLLNAFETYPEDPGDPKRQARQSLQKTTDKTLHIKTCFRAVGQRYLHAA